MSWNTFKSNMLRYMQNQKGINSYNDFASKLTTEYDLCIRRGTQTINNIPLQTPNKALMLTLVTAACQMALTKRSGNHTFIDDIGKGVIGYWTGATLVIGIPPPIPATGAIVNITTTSAFVTNPGTWSPVGQTPPLNDSQVFLDMLTAAMIAHSATPQGLYLTISNYPGFPLVPPAPGVLNFTGWTVPG